MPKGDYARIPVELWNERVWVSPGVGDYSEMERLRGGVLRWWRINITKVLMKYFNGTSFLCRIKLKGTRKTSWGEVSSMYIC